MYEMFFTKLPDQNGIHDCQNFIFNEIEPRKASHGANRIQYSDAFKGIVEAFLAKRPEDRIGSLGGASQIFEHEWFTDTQQPHHVDIDMVVQGSF